MNKMPNESEVLSQKVKQQHEQFLRRFRDIVGGDFPIEQAHTGSERSAVRTSLLNSLSGWVFDLKQIPDLAPLVALGQLAEDWLQVEKSSRVFELKGVVFYLQQEWAKAAQAFLASISYNPQNIEIWSSLAFSLNHLGLDLGYDILFNLEIYIELSAEPAQRQELMSRGKQSQHRLLSLASLKQLSKQVAAHPDYYAKSAVCYVEKYF